MSILDLPQGIHADVPEGVHHGRVIGVVNKGALDVLARTPGPWHVHKANRWSHVKSANGDYVMEGNYRGVARQHADARLIAAAPDLFSAHDLGEKVISAFVAMTADGRLDCRNPAVIELCEALSAYQQARDAAIAKATGGAA